MKMIVQSYENNLLTMLPEEIIIDIFNMFSLREIYQILGRINKYCNSIVENEYFCRKLLKNYYPNFSDIMLSTSAKENLKKIHKIMNDKIVPKELKYKVGERTYYDKTLILPYNIIAKIFNLPKLEMMYTEIIGYLRCGDFKIERLKDFSFNRDISYRVSLFSYLKDKKLFEKCNAREKIDITVEDLLSKLDPINLKDANQFENNNQEIYAITLQFHYDIVEIFYSGLNSERHNVQKLFEEVKKDYRTKYS